MKTYVFTYWHNGALYGFELKADSPEDAQEHLLRLPHAELQGELYAKVPAHLGFITRLWCWLMNRRSHPP